MSVLSFDLAILGSLERLYRLVRSYRVEELEQAWKSVIRTYRFGIAGNALWVGGDKYASGENSKERRHWGAVGPIPTISILLVRVIHVVIIFTGHYDPNPNGKSGGHTPS